MKKLNNHTKLLGKFSPRIIAAILSNPNGIWTNLKTFWASWSGEYSPNPKDSKTGSPKEFNCFTVLSEKY